MMHGQKPIKLGMILSVVVGFLYMSNERLSFSFNVVMFRKLVLYSFSSCLVNFMVGIKLLNALKTSYMLVVVLLHAMRMSSTYRK
jgi:hypothetical protein